MTNLERAFDEHPDVFAAWHSKTPQD